MQASSRADIAYLWSVFHGLATEVSYRESVEFLKHVFVLAVMRDRAETFAENTYTGAHLLFFGLTGTVEVDVLLLPTDDDDPPSDPANWGACSCRTM